MMNSTQNVQSTAMKQSKTDIINALKKNFTTTVRRIYINSLNKDVGFREITVQEQKSLSRIMIDNEERKDIMYDAQCAIINQVALDEDFDIYQVSEFDKIKLLIALYQTNVVKNDITFTCKECGTENKYKIDFTETLAKLDNISLEDQEFDFETVSWKFKFTVGYPFVNRVSNFYKSYALKYKTADKKQKESMNNMINLDYINMYIKRVVLTNKTTGEVTDLNLLDFTPSEVNDIMSTFPQDVLYAQDGIMQYISKDFISKINSTFEKHTCATCGHEHEYSLDKDMSSFF